MAIEGRILSVEPSLDGVRVTMDQLRMPRLFDWSGKEEPIPERIRVRFGQMEENLRIGGRIVFRGGLSPPSPPAVAGAYDFARSAWFMRLGAVGYAVNAPEILSEGENIGDFRDAGFFALTELRLSFYDRIKKSVEEAGFPSGTAEITAALITGQQGAIPPETMKAYRDSGLAHILSISGLHMSIVAGLIFVGIRAILASIPFIALRYPIKKWTAAAAIVIIFFYLLIAGSTPPPQRSFIMCSIVMLAVIFDRSALSLRTMSCAMFIVLLLAPEALIGASFQMSFAAVYMMIAVYELAGPKIRLWQAHHSGLMARISFYLLGILLTTLVAGTATALYGIYHFGRYPSYSLLSNLLAIPIISFWVMPMAIIAALLTPFGLDPIFWKAMGAGVALVGEIARQIAALPGAAIDLPSMPVASLIAVSFGMMWLALWRQIRLKLWGASGVLIGFLLWAIAEPPDILVDGSGKLAAVRMEDGRLAFSSLVFARNTRKTWANQNGQGEDYPKWGEKAGVAPRCDAYGCAYSAKGQIVAFSHRGEALPEDCQRADLVIAMLSFSGSCPQASMVIDARDLRRQGTHSLWLREGTIKVETVAGFQGARLWRSYEKPVEKTEREQEDGDP